MPALRASVLIGLACATGCKHETAVTKKPPVAAAGSATVAAPDPGAPVAAVDSVTTASPEWKPGPAVVVAPSAPAIDGAALRATHRKRIKADTSPVTVLTGGTARELGEHLCQLVVPRRSASTPVLLKPNLGGFDWFHDPKKHKGDDGVKGRITDPEFVRGVVDCLKARGHTAITIADGFTGKPEDWQRLIRVSGYEAMAKDEGVPLVALDDDGVWDVEGDTPGKPLPISGLEHTHVQTLLMPKVLADHLDHGLYISIPKIKAHRFAVFSFGIKSMQGSVMYSDAAPAFRQKWRSHKELDKALAAIKQGAPDARKTYVKALELFAERMVDVLELEAPDVELAEGTPAMSGDGFQHLFPGPENVAIGGTNVITVDRVAAQYLGLWDSAALAAELGGHRTSPLLEVAAKRFGVDIARPRITGNGADLLAARRPAHLIGMAGFEIDEAGDVGDGAPGDGAPATAPAPATGKEVHAAMVEGDGPTIDGVIDDAWAAATPIRFTTDWAGRETSTTTQVRILWSPRGLFLLWELEATGLNTDRTRPVDTERIDLYEEDSVELFLAPDPANRERYFEIELGPYGHFFDLLVDHANHHSDNAWSAGPRIGTTRDETAHRAVIEVALEGPDVIAVMKPGATLPLGLYRMEGTGKRLYLAAFPTHTAKPSFHVPEAFGTVTLDP